MNKNSLIFKLFSIFLIMLVTIPVAFYLFFEINMKNIAYEMEHEKARSLTSMFKGSISVALDLNLGEDIRFLIKQAMRLNNDILKINIKNVNGEIVVSEHVENFQSIESIKIVDDIHDEILKKKIGYIELYYSMKYYNQMMEERNLMLQNVAIMIFVLLLFFVYYLEVTLNPLLQLINSILSFDIKSKVNNIRTTDRKDEIGLIQNTISNVFDKSIEYAAIIEDLISDLEERVEERTVELRESEQHFKALSEKSLTGVYLIFENKFIYVNKTLADTLGYAVSEIIGRSPFEFIYKEDIDNLKMTINKKLNYEPLEQGYQARAVTRSGDTIYLNIYSTVVDYHGEVALLGNTLDITEKIKNEKDIKLLSTALEQTADTVLITDREGNIIYVNKAFIEQTGFTKDEVIDKNPKILKSNQMDADFYKNMWDIILNKEVFRGVFINKKKNGDIFYEQKTISPILGSNFEINYFVSNGKDITDLIKIENDLRDKKDELEKLNIELENRVQTAINEQKKQQELLIQQSKLAAIGELIGNIAHQWRQPLTQISGALMNIELRMELNRLDNNYLIEKIKESNMSLNYMSKTIDDFRNFFAPDKSAILFSLNGCLKKSLKILESTFKAKNITINLIELDECSIFGYSGEYSQVILNILTNAKDIFEQREIKDRVIVIELKKDDDCCLLSIEDNAGGIHVEPIDKIFEPYFSTKHQTQGTGIGLYMSKIIIENNMKGKLLVENTNNGAKFIIKNRANESISN
ncbi:MAG: PAS domain-containing sensor histidine kinase [Campylobacterales bacterium]|nr:PAS domain-containing sensor histidine kinase [Campylobacterales bacterium]